jgi:hypothetical protein
LSFSLEILQEKQWKDGPATNSCFRSAGQLRSLDVKLSLTQYRNLDFQVWGFRSACR